MSVGFKIKSKSNLSQDTQYKKYFWTSVISANIIKVNKYLSLQNVLQGNNFTCCPRIYEQWVKGSTLILPILRTLLGILLSGWCSRCAKLAEMLHVPQNMKIFKKPHSFLLYTLLYILHSERISIQFFELNKQENFFHSYEIRVCELTVSMSSHFMSGVSPSSLLL